jgi:stage V sporulation protein AC
VDLSPREYQAYIKRKQEPSPLLKNMALAFVTGETICVLGQLLINGYQAPGLYHRLARFAGAGTLVPITGFANAVVSPAVDFRAEGLVTGTAVRMFTIAGPVIVFGTAASAVYGVFLLLLGG